MKLLGKSLFFALFTLITLHSQTGTRLVGFDARSMGRGGTSIGTYDGTELMMTNPAGISFLNSSMVNADISLMLPTLNFENTINKKEGDKNTFPMPAAAYVHKYKSSPFSWGIGLFTTGGMGADFTLNHLLFRDNTGNYVPQKYHSKLGSMQGGITMAYKFSDKFSAGVTLHAVYSMLEFSMPYSLNPSVMKGFAMPGMTFGQLFAAPQAQGGFGYTEVTAAADMSELTAFGFNGKIGLAYKFDESLSFGINYSLPVNLTYKNGKASMDMSYQLNDAFGKAVMGYMQQNPGASQQQAQAAVAAQFGQMGIDLSKGVAAKYNLETELKFPQSVGFGLGFKASEKISLSADIEWLNWANAFDKMIINLSNGDNQNINTMLGNSGNFQLEFPLNWKNSLVVKLGGEFILSEAFTGRIGYAYGSDPVPDETVFPVFPAIVENHITAGLSYRASSVLVFHGAVETALNKKQTAAIPSTVASEYNGSTSELSTLLFHLSATWLF